MRLIDADKLMKEICDLRCGEKQKYCECGHTAACGEIARIRDFPTAYDVEKVAKEIEEWRRCKDPCGPGPKCCDFLYNELIDVYDAADIVRNGVKR